MDCGGEGDLAVMELVWVSRHEVSVSKMFFCVFGCHVMLFGGLALVNVGSLVSMKLVRLSLGNLIVIGECGQLPPSIYRHLNDLYYFKWIKNLTHCSEKLSNMYLMNFPHFHDLHGLGKFTVLTSAWENQIKRGNSYSAFNARSSSRSLPISSGHFPPTMNSKRQPYLALMGELWLFFLSLKSRRGFTYDTAVLCAISCYIVRRYIESL